MKEIRLVMDLDGVLFDFNTHFVQLGNDTFPHLNCPVPGDEYPDKWDYLDDHLTRAELRVLWHKIAAGRTFWATCPTYEHSEQLLIEAQNRANKLYFLTSRSGKDVQKQTHHALQQVASHYTTHGAVIAVPRPELKIPIINSLDATHFVDDKPETIKAAHEQCYNTKIAIWDQPWNRDFHLGVARLKNVEDFITWLG